jgi:hypothetical protein
MAIRKATMQEQVREAIAQVAPGDRVVVTFNSVTGPSPWLLNFIGVLSQFLVKYYFITLTEQAVVFHKASRVSSRPKELVFAIPRAQAQTLISKVERNPLWSSFRFHIPNDEKPTRINVARVWRDELDQFVQALTGPLADKV